MSEVQGLNYKARNSKKGMLFPHRQSSPLIQINRKTKKTGKLYTQSTPVSRKHSITSGSIGNSCNISRGQILIEEFEQGLNEIVVSQCKDESGEQKLQRVDKQNNLISEYLNRVKNLQEIRKMEEQELEFMKKCLDVKGLIGDTLAEIKEEVQSNSSQLSQSNEPISPISVVNRALEEAKNKNALESLKKPNRIEFNPQSESQQQKKRKNDTNTIEASLAAYTQNARQLQTLINLLPSEQFLTYFNLYNLILKEKKMKQQQYLRQQKQKQILNALLCLQHRGLNNIESYILSSNLEDEQISQNRLLILSLVRQITQ